MVHYHFYLSVNHTCEFSEWSDWSDCSKTCGYGTRVRTRDLLNDIPGVPDEELCVTVEEKRCRLRKCPKRECVYVYVYMRRCCRMCVAKSMCVRVCVCVCVCVYVRECVCVHVYGCMYESMCVGVGVCERERKRERGSKRV